MVRALETALRVGARADTEQFVLVARAHGRCARPRPQTRARANRARRGSALAGLRARAARRSGGLVGVEAAEGRARISLEDGRAYSRQAREFSEGLRLDGTRAARTSRRAYA